MTDLFIVGKFIKETKEGNVWEFSGVFDSEEKAIDACISPYYFIGPIALNFCFPDERVNWPGAYYPKK